MGIFSRSINKPKKDKNNRKERQQKIKVIKEYFQKHIGGESKSCDIGLDVRFSFEKSGCGLYFSLDNLGKDKVMRLIGEGKLYEEIMLLYELAHLPYARFHTMNMIVGNQYFDIIDRVIIFLGEAFHPLQEEKYKKLRDSFINFSLVNLEGRDVYLINKGIAWITQRKTGKLPEEIVLEEEK